MIYLHVVVINVKSNADHQIREKIAEIANLFSSLRKLKQEIRPNYQVFIFEHFTQDVETNLDVI